MVKKLKRKRKLGERREGEKKRGRERERKRESGRRTNRNVVVDDSNWRPGITVVEEVRRGHEEPTNSERMVEQERERRNRE